MILQQIELRRLEGIPRHFGYIACDTQATVRYFNTEGPVVADEHYCIPPLDRVDVDAILELVRRKKYFVLHAPRQTGKTSLLKALADRLNVEGTYVCLYINVEGGQAFRENVDEVVRIILSQIASRSRITLQDNSLEALSVEVLQHTPPGNALYEFLTRWSAASVKPVVLLVDEIDSLLGDSLISVLRQLRSGYDLRPGHFPQSVVLCGIRDVRDYRIYSSAERASVAGGSAFNVKAESLRLGDFSEAEVRTLLMQHTAETGQKFETEASALVWDLTRGQPWLVNALVYEACFRSKDGRVRSRPISAGAIYDAKETLIEGRVTHLDQLADKLREERVQRVILPMIAGSSRHAWTVRDLEYLRDLGLVAPDYPVRMANPVYAEVIPRELTLPLEATLAEEALPEWFLNADGSLDIVGLLSAFQGYFRENSESWVERFGHREAGPLLVLHAYLQRVINSGGRISREYAVGRRRTDLLIEWPKSRGRNPACTEKHVIECKVLRSKTGLERLVHEGRIQTSDYMDKCGADSGHLVIFDTRPGKSWEERLFRRDPGPGQLPITVWGM